MIQTLKSIKLKYLIATFHVAMLWPAIGFAAAPELIAAWSDRGDDFYTVYTSQKVDGEWSAPTSITESKNRVLSVAIGSNNLINLDEASGFVNTLVVWTEVVGKKWVLKFANSQNGKWTDIENLTAIGGENLSPTILYDLAGNAWVFWSSNLRGNDDIYFKRKIDGQWSNSQIVNQENEAPDILPSARLDKEGNVVVEWKTLDLISNSYKQAGRVFPLKAKSKNRELKKDNLNIDLPPNAGSAKRINVHFPKNIRTQSMYIQPN